MLLELDWTAEFNRKKLDLIIYLVKFCDKMFMYSDRFNQSVLFKKKEKELNLQKKPVQNTFIHASNFLYTSLSWRLSEQVISDLNYHSPQPSLTAPTTHLNLPGKKDANDPVLGINCCKRTNQGRRCSFCEETKEEEGEFDVLSKEERWQID